MHMNILIHISLFSVLLNEIGESLILECRMAAFGKDLLCLELKKLLSEPVFTNRYKYIKEVMVVH